MNGWKEPNGWLVSAKRRDGSITRCDADDYDAAVFERAQLFEFDDTVESVWIFEKTYRPQRGPKKAAPS